MPTVNSCGRPATARMLHLFGGSVQAQVPEARPGNLPLAVRTSVVADTLRAEAVVANASRRAVRVRSSDCSLRLVGRRVASDGRVADTRPRVSHAHDQPEGDSRTAHLAYRATGEVAPRGALGSGRRSMSCAQTDAGDTVWIGAEVHPVGELFVLSSLRSAWLALGPLVVR